MNEKALIQQAIGNLVALMQVCPDPDRDKTYRSIIMLLVSLRGTIDEDTVEGGMY